MVVKLLFFGAGYLLGTHAGTERYHELVNLGKQLAQRDEVKMAVSVARGMVEDRIGALAGAAEGQRAA